MYKTVKQQFEEKKGDRTKRWKSENEKREIEQEDGRVKNVKDKRKFLTERVRQNGNEFLYE